MDKNTILAMEGNKLRAEVAQRIMGIKVEYPFAEGYPYYLREDKDGKVKWDIVPDYPGDISAAWQVVEKMFELGFAMSLLHLSSKFYPEYWYCDFRPKDSNKPPEYEWVDHQMTAPVAICKAALLTRQTKEAGRRKVSETR